MRSSTGRMFLAAALLLGGFGIVFAEEQPTPTPVAKGGDQTLSDVAGGIKLDRKAAGGENGIVISNENLADLAGKGRVTEVTKSGANQTSRGLSDVQGTGDGVEGQAPGVAENMEKKAYWQALYDQELKLLQNISKQIDALDYEIPGLWRQFYSWDDPAYRDGVIKPKLDEALAQRQKLEVDKKKSEANLTKIKKSAQRDGGQPGWFRHFDKPPTPRPTTGVMPP